MRKIQVMIGFFVILFLCGLSQPVMAKQKGNYQNRTRITDIVNTDQGICFRWEKRKNVDGYAIFRDGTLLKKIAANQKPRYLDKKADKNGQVYKYWICTFQKKNKRIRFSKPSRTRIQVYLEKNSLAMVRRKGKTTDFSWTKNTKGSGYQIAFSRKPNPKTGQVLTVSGRNKSTCATAKLSPKRSYYVWVRTYRRGKKWNSYSPWSRGCKVISYESGWEFADCSAIHSDSATLYYSDQRKRKDKIICINAGHGTVGGEQAKTYCHPDQTPKVTGGSTAKGATKAAAVSGGTSMLDGTPEKTVTLKVALAAKEKLLQAGYHVLMIRETEDVQLDNVARTVMANQNADCHIAIHYDSSVNDKGAFYIGVPDNASYRAMYPVSENWKKHNALGESLLAGFKECGVKVMGSGSMNIDLTQTSYSTIPSVDVEVGDRSSDHSAAALEKIAKGIVSGLDAFYML